MAVNFPECPASLKSILHYLKAAQEHDGRDEVISYWCRLYALQVGLKISSHQPDETKLLIAIMDWLETKKKELADNESVTNDVAAQAYIENYALRLFQFADKNDRASNFGKNVVKAFYSTGLLYDVLQTFGELTDEAAQNRKYAKWKAAYIHNCLKTGETPVAGPIQKEDGEDELGGGEEGAGNFGNDPGTPSSSHSENLPNNNYGFTPPPPSTIDLSSSLPTNPSLGEVARRLPSPPTEPEKPPGGFQAYVPPAVGNIEYEPPTPQTGVKLTPEQITKAQKYCKWAGSALTYDDINSAIENLQKGLKLLITGQDS